MADKLNVSLEPHLQDALTSLLHILPKEISQELKPRLSHESHATAVPVIPYDLVLQTSTWCQTNEGKMALEACSPPLDPQCYTMTSLLAGVCTSPEKRFPPYISKDPEEDRRLQSKDRKAIASLVNAVLSVIGTGIATWWASEYTGMRLEWRALLAVFAALVVALAEIVLYMIWDSRQTSDSRRPAPKYAVVRHRDLDKNDSVNITPRGSSTAIGPAILRHRATAPATESRVPS